TYTVFWRPPGDRPVRPDEQAVLEPFVDRLIALTRPKALLVLGAGAARSVLREDGALLALRGRWFERSSDDGALKTPACVSFTPAFLLRQPGSKKLFWTDLLALTERLGAQSRPEINLPAT
ncbi:MAG: uracil-DNA glycosylase, partial [Pseudomonadota bacterium]|nr:uracil-DNA glycosylase [Pseudomonadota bacterium]